MVKQVWGSIFCAIAIAFVSAGCGGGGSSSQKMVDLTVSVPTAGTLKKGKNSKTVSITDVKGVVLADETEVNGKENDGTFIISVPEGSDVHIQATITDENGSEFTFESFVNDASESEQIVDEDSTRVANLLVYEGVKNNTSIKDLLLSENDVIGDWKELLVSFQNRDALNELLENAESEESVDDLANKVADLIAELKEINRILAIFENRLELFASSNDVIKIGALSEVDVVSSTTDDESDSDVINEFLVRPAGVKGIAAGETTGADVDATRSTVYINEDGSVSVERDGESSTTDSILTKDRFSGHFLSYSEAVLVIGVKHRGSVTKEEFYISEDSKDLIALVESFQEGDSIAITYTEDDAAKRVVKAIFAEGFLSGKLTELSKTSVTIELSNGTTVTMPIKDYSDKIIFTLPPESETSKINPIVRMPVEGNPIVRMPVETETTIKSGKDNVTVRMPFEGNPIVRMPVEGAKKPKPDAESTDPIFETTTGVETTDGDIEVLTIDGEELIEIENSDVKIGDLVIIHWKVIENVKFSIAIYPDLPISIDDPIAEIESTRPISEDTGDVKEEDSELLANQ